MQGRKLVCWLILGCFLLQATLSPVDGTIAQEKVTIKLQDDGVKAAASDSLTIREARRMGITFVSMLRAARQLKQEGKLDKETSSAEATALIAQKLFEDNKAAWGDPAAINWDAILAFIEAFIPLLLQIISLFSQASTTVPTNWSMIVPGSPPVSLIPIELGLAS